MRKMVFVIAIFVFAASLSAAAVAKDDAPAGKTPLWRQQLEFQLVKEKSCQVNYLSNVVIKKIDGDEAILARAHCMDQRAFDVSRPKSGQPFEIKECAVQTC